MKTIEDLKKAIAQVYSEKERQVIETMIDLAFEVGKCEGHKAAIKNLRHIYEK
jgi:hypothetical protein